MPPGCLMLLSPRVISRTLTDSEGFLLWVETVLLVGAGESADNHSWTRNTCRDAHPQVGNHVISKVQSDKGIVVNSRARSPRRHFGVHAIRRAEQQDRLVDQVTPEIPQETSARLERRVLTPGIGPNSRSVAFEPGLEPR